MGDGRALRADAVNSATYDAFLSYAHADASLVVVVQRALRVIGKPWYRRRALRVFSDQTGLSANPGLWTSIATALDGSEWFVLLASPAAAASPWVDAEVAYWLEHRDRSRLLPVLTDGDWVWSRERNDFDTDRSSAVPPSLIGAFDEEPRHIDLRWARDNSELSPRTPRLRDQVAEIAAPMHGLSKEDLIGDDLRQHRRTRRTVRAAIGLLLLLTLVAAASAVDAAQSATRARASEARAVHARADSDFQRVIAQSRDLRQSRLDLALLLAVQARHIHDTPESRGAIQAAILEDPRYLGPIVEPRVESPLGGLCVTAHGDTAVVGAFDGTWGLVDLKSGKPIGSRRRLAPPLANGQSFIGCSLDRSDEGVLFTTAGRVWTFDARSQRTGSSIDLHHQIDTAVISPDGQWVAAATLDGRVVAWPRDDPKKMRSFDTGGATDAQAVAFSPDGRLLASTTDNEIVVRDAHTWNIVRRIADAPETQAGALVTLAETSRNLLFSPDGSLLVNSRRTVVRAIDAKTGSVRWESRNDYTGGTHVAVAPDTRSVFLSDTSGLIQQLDARTGTAIAVPIRPPSLGTTMAVDPAGNTLLMTSDVNGQIWRWALDGRSTISSFIPAPGQRLFGASPDGRLFVVVPSGSQAVTSGVVMDPRTRQTVYPFAPVAYPTLLDDQTLRGFFVSELAVDGVDLHTKHFVGPRFPVSLAGVDNVAVGARGDIFVAYDDGAIRWFLPNGRQIGNPWKRVNGPPAWMAISPHGDLVAITTSDSAFATGSVITVYRTKDGSRVHVMHGFATAFNGDGTALGFFAADNRLNLLDTRTFRSKGIATNDRTYQDLNLTGRNVFLLEATTQGQLFDWKTLRPIGDPFASIDEPVILDDGKTLVTNTAAGLVLWDLDPNHWETAACSMAGRNLTTAEWRTYFPSNPTPQSTCPQWPPPR